MGGRATAAATGAVVAATLGAGDGGNDATVFGSTTALAWATGLSGIARVADRGISALGSYSGQFRAMNDCAWNDCSGSFSGGIDVDRGVDSLESGCVGILLIAGCCSFSSRSIRFNNPSRSARALWISALS